jgi:hypothetical protein
MVCSKKLSKTSVLNRRHQLLDFASNLWQSLQTSSVLVGADTNRDTSTWSENVAGGEAGRYATWLRQTGREREKYPHRSTTTIRSHFLFKVSSG